MAGFYSRCFGVARFASVVGAAIVATVGVRALGAPVLTTYNATLTTNPPAVPQTTGAGVPKVAQPIGMTYFHRGVFLDGTDRLPWSSSGAEIGANESDPAGLGDRSVEDVRLITGQYEPTEIDLHLPCIGPDWVIGRSRVATVQTGTANAGTVHGNGWYQTSQARIWFEDNSNDADDVVYLFYGGDRYLEFRRVVIEGTAYPTFRGVNGASGAITFVGMSSEEESRSSRSSYSTESFGGGVAFPPDVWTYHDPTGITVDFFGWEHAAITDGSVVHDGSGQIWRITDASGYVSYVGDATDAATAIVNGYDDEGRITNAWDSAGRKYEYAYGTIASTAKRLTSVTVTKASTTIAEVDYAYYTSATAEGASAIGDLKTATVKTPVSSAVSTSATLDEVTRYRYWKSGASAIDGYGVGPAGSVRLVLGPEGSRRAGSGADTASDSTLAGYGALRMGYSGTTSTGKVNLLSSAGLTSRMVALDYGTPTTSPTLTSGYDNVWVKRTGVAVRDGSPTSSTFVTSTDYFFDEVAQAMHSVRLAADYGGTSAASVLATNVARDSMGCVTKIASPEATSITVSGYAPGASSLTGASTGLVVNFTRIATSGSPADLAGYVTAVKRASGWSSTPVVQSEIVYYDPLGHGTAAESADWLHDSAAAGGEERAVSVFNHWRGDVVCVWIVLNERSEQFTGDCD